MCLTAPESISYLFTCLFIIIVTKVYYWWSPSLQLWTEWILRLIPNVSKRGRDRSSHSRKGADDIFQGCSPKEAFVKREKKKVLQKMWELYSWVWLNIGLFRLFQKLASHVCVIFFFFPLSLFGILFSVLFWAPQHSSFIPFVSRRRTSSWKASPASIATMPLILWPLEPLTTRVCWSVAALLF